MYVSVGRDALAGSFDLHRCFTHWLRRKSANKASNKSLYVKYSRGVCVCVPCDQALSDHTNTFVLEWCRGRSCYFQYNSSFKRANSLRVVQRILCKHVIAVNLLPFFRTSCRHASHWGLVKSTTSGWRRTCGIYLKQVSSVCSYFTIYFHILLSLL